MIRIVGIHKILAYNYIHLTEERILMDSIKGLMGMSTEEENQSCFPQLSFKERMIGFATCVGLGLHDPPVIAYAV
jgi:hypothetical protein